MKMAANTSATDVTTKRCY